MVHLNELVAFQTFSISSSNDAEGFLFGVTLQQPPKSTPATKLLFPNKKVLKKL